MTHYPSFLLVIILSAYACLAAYLASAFRKRFFIPIILANAFSLSWMIFAKDEYSYNHGFPLIFGISIFPLICWAAGLSFGYVSFTWLRERWDGFHHLGFPATLAIFSSYYWMMLVAVETAGYHVFNVHNDAAAKYAGLPVCDCIHAPVWMQLSYFLMGPFYYALCHYSMRWIKRKRDSRHIKAETHDL